jgi:hypothetical protein
MGLWDILVPSEPGVLHNTIANPSFEYENNEIDAIVIETPTYEGETLGVRSFRTLPANAGLMYWSELGSAAISKSSYWASQGAYSLKVNSGISQFQGVSYNPRLSTINVSDVAISVSQTTTSWSGSIPNATAIKFAVVGLSDLGISLSNGLADTQVYSGTTENDRLPYLTIDALRGHTTPIFRAAGAYTTSSTDSLRISISGGQSKAITVRAWAIWYSTSVGTTETYTLAAIVPADPTVATVAYIHKIINAPSIPTSKTGFLSIFPFDTNLKRVQGTATTFLSDVSVNSDLYVDTPDGDKQFLGRVASISSNTVLYLQNTPTTIPMHAAYYVAVEANPQTFPGNTVGGIGTFQYNTSTAAFLPAAIGLDCTAPYFGITNAGFGGFTAKHHLYFDWYIASPDVVNPNATYTDTGANWSVYLVNNQSRTAGSSTISTISLSSKIVTFAASVSLTKGDMLYTAAGKYIGTIATTASSTSHTLVANALVTVAGGSSYMYIPYNAGTLLGTLDSSTVTSTNARRMSYRKKFLIDRPSAATDTSDMSIRFVYSGTTSDADLYIDGVQFVDVGMIWRSYDFYTASSSQYVSPPQFSDWDWDDVEFSYIDGDVPGAIWSDSMPTQSGTTSAAFPYFTNSGVWMQDFNEYDVVQDAGGYASPRFREQRQWRNDAKPVYGVSIPGLSQSSLLTQTFSTGFWAPLNTNNINVVVEPTISGPGMPEISTTALEYGIIDGGFVQRQVARMRNMQFTVTVSAQSWTGLHANRRSLINLLKFDQLAQQGERMMRYRGADTPVVTRITYTGGLEYNGVQGTSFTEVMALKFLSSDPYFYASYTLSADISPIELPIENANVFYRLGNASAWVPLSVHKYSPSILADGTLSEGSVEATRVGTPYFYNKSNVVTSPKALGWLQSPSGNVSTLVVGGDFSYPFSTLAFFYVSGFAPDTKASAYNLVVTTGTGTINILAGTESTVRGGSFTSSDIGKSIFIPGGIYVGKISGFTSATQVTIAEPYVAFAATSYQLVTVVSQDVDALPLQVYGRELYQFVGGTATANASVNAIYQESPTSLLVAGNFYQVIDYAKGQPNLNFGGTNTKINSGYVTSSIISSDTQDITAYPLYRIVRMTMNDNGKITVYPVDSQFVYDSTSTTYRSLLYNLIEDQSITSLTKAPSGFVFSGTNTISGITKYDETLSSTNPTRIPIWRSLNAFGDILYQSNIISVNPAIALSSTSESVDYAGFVGFRMGAGGPGVISVQHKSPTQSFVMVGSTVDGVGTNFTANDVGKLIFLQSGLYVGQIYNVFASSGGTQYVWLTEAPTITFFNQPYNITSPIQSLTTDKKTSRSSLYAALSSDDTVRMRSGVWGYINNPTNAVGKLSYFAGSRSIGYTADLTDALAVDTSTSTKEVYVSTTSDTVYGNNTSFNSKMIGNILLDSDGQYIGLIAAVSGSNRLRLSQEAFSAIGEAPPAIGGLGKISINKNTTKVTGTNTNFATSPTTDVNKYLYWYPTNSIATPVYIGQIRSVDTLTQCTLYAAYTGANLSGKQFFLSTNKVFAGYSIRTQKIFTDATGYIARTSTVTVSANSTKIGSTALPVSGTSSNTQILGTNINAYALYTDMKPYDSTDNPVIKRNIMNATQSTTGTIIRRYFGNSVRVAAFDPPRSSATISTYSNVYASFPFGSLYPNIPAQREGTITISGTTITGAATVGARTFFTASDINKAVYVFIGNRPMYVGLISAVASTTSATLAANSLIGDIATAVSYTFVAANGDVALTLTTGANTISSSTGSTSVTVAGTPSATSLIGQYLYTINNEYVGLVVSAVGSTATLSANALITISPADNYRYSSSSAGLSVSGVHNNSTDLVQVGGVIANTSASPWVSNASNPAMVDWADVGRSVYFYNSGQWYFQGFITSISFALTTPRIFLNKGSSFATTNTLFYMSGGNTNSISPETVAGNTITTSLSSTSITVAGTAPTAFGLVGSHLYSKIGEYIGHVAGAISPTSAFLRNNALVAVTTATYRYSELRTWDRSITWTPYQFENSIGGTYWSNSNVGLRISGTPTSTTYIISSDGGSSASFSIITTATGSNIAHGAANAPFCPVLAAGTITVTPNNKTVVRTSGTWTNNQVVYSNTGVFIGIVFSGGGTATAILYDYPNPSAFPSFPNPLTAINFYVLTLANATSMNTIGWPTSYDLENRALYDPSSAYIGNAINPVNASADSTPPMFNVSLFNPNLILRSPVDSTIAVAQQLLLSTLSTVSTQLLLVATVGATTGTISGGTAGQNNTLAASLVGNWIWNTAGTGFIGYVISSSAAVVTFAKGAVTAQAAAAQFYYSNHGSYQYSHLPAMNYSLYSYINGRWLHGGKIYSFSPFLTTTYFYATNVYWYTAGLTQTVAGRTITVAIGASVYTFAGTVPQVGWHIYNSAGVYIGEIATNSGTFTLTAAANAPTVGGLAERYYYTTTPRTINITPTGQAANFVGYSISDARNRYIGEVISYTPATSSSNISSITLSSNALVGVDSTVALSNRTLRIRLSYPSTTTPVAFVKDATVVTQETAVDFDGESSYTDNAELFTYNSDANPADPILTYFGTVQKSEARGSGTLKFTYMPYWGQAGNSIMNSNNYNQNPFSTSLAGNSTVLTGAKAFRGSPKNFFADVVGYVAGETLNGSNSTQFEEITLENTPDVITPNINHVLKSSGTITASVGSTTVSFSLTTTSAGNTITTALNSTSVTVAGTPNAYGLIGRMLYTTGSVYIGTVSGATSSGNAILTALPLTAVTTATYRYTDDEIPYYASPGDVIRYNVAGDSDNTRIVGQIQSIDVESRRFILTADATVKMSPAAYSIHKKPSATVFIGTIPSASSITIAYNTTTGVVTGTNTYFSIIPYDPLYNTDVANGTAFYFYDAIAGWTKLGVIASITSDTSMVLTNAYAGSSFGATTVTQYGYATKYLAGLGRVSSTRNGFLYSGLTATNNPTRMSKQVYSGAAITYSPITTTVGGNTILVTAGSTSVTVAGTPAATALVGKTLYTSGGAYVGVVASASSATSATLVSGAVTAVSPAANYQHSDSGLVKISGLTIDVLSSYGLLLGSEFGSPFIDSVARTNCTYYINYRYDEFPIIDSGDTISTNIDWQNLGLQNQQVKDLTTTQNGDIIASGKFTTWADRTDTYARSVRSVNYIARVVPLVTNGFLADAYGTPIVGTSYVRNGMNNYINMVRDITDVNPINGYVGSGDKIMIGGKFTRTADNENVSPNLVYVEGSTISGNLQTIVSADIQLPSYSEVFSIATTNRLRQYTSNPATSVLDGISGANVAIVTSAVQPDQHMQFYSMRVRGNAAVYPVITIRNDLSSRLLYELFQTETGARIRFTNNGLSVLPYERIVLNMQPGQRSITSTIRGNLISFVHPMSNFVDFVLLGANNSAGKSTQAYDDYRLNVIGVHAQAGLVVTITYVPRFWSFDANNLFFGTTKAGA